MIKRLTFIIIVALIVCASFPSYAMGQFLFFGNPLVGKKAPDFTLETTNENKVNMTEYRGGQSAIIFFWATWCPHCRTALNKLNRDYETFKQKNIKLILVDIQEDKKTIQAYQQKHNIAMDVFLDINASLAEPYNIVGVPTFIFVNKQGIVTDTKNELPSNYEMILKK